MGGIGEYLHEHGWITTADICKHIPQLLGTWTRNQRPFSSPWLTRCRNACGSSGRTTWTTECYHTNHLGKDIRRRPALGTLFPRSPCVSRTCQWCRSSLLTMGWRGDTGGRSCEPSSWRTSRWRQRSRRRRGRECGGRVRHLGERGICIYRSRHISSRSVWATSHGCTGSHRSTWRETTSRRHISHPCGAGWPELSIRDTTRNDGEQTWRPWLMDLSSTSIAGMAATRTTAEARV